MGKAKRNRQQRAQAGSSPSPGARTLDHELKLQRAGKHLEDLETETQAWLGLDRYSVRYEFDLETRWNGPEPPGLAGVPPGGACYYLAGSVFIPDQGPGTPPDNVEFGQGSVTAYATADQPPTDPFGLLIGDALHNMRSALDALAYALTLASGKPLTETIRRQSEFPIFGDEDRNGTPGVGSARFHAMAKSGTPIRGSGLAKVEGWKAGAQAAIEGLQPYHRGNAFRTDPLWILQELDNVNKHRLLHPTMAALAGTLWDINRFANVRAIGPGMIQIFAGPVQADTPIARFIGIHPIDPNREMHVKIDPAMDIALSEKAPAAAGESVLAIMGVLYAHIRDEVLPRLTPFL